MSNLKFYMNNDLSTFFNDDEFAEYHDIDGQQILAVIDSDQFNERPKDPAELYHLTNGIYRSSITMYVKSADYDKPVIGQRISVDEEDYYVVSVSEDTGLLKIIATANEA